MIVANMVEVEITECCVCGVKFGVPPIVMDERRRNAGGIYCPNGHCIGWKESEADKLKRTLAYERAALARERAAHDQTRAADQAKAKELATLKKRASLGICPCCEGQFRNLRSHMRRKHPEFSKAGKDKK
jgi:hypothetical protein